MAADEREGSTAAIAEAAGNAMIHTSQLATGFAAIALVVGLLATFRQPRSTLAPQPEVTARPSP